MERQQPNQPTAAEQRKKQKDAGRARHGNLQHKRVHVLLNPAKLAFRGWEAASQPWTLATCEQFIEWCHIGKLFPLHRHNKQSYFKQGEHEMLQEPSVREAVFGGVAGSIQPER